MGFHIRIFTLILITSAATFAAKPGLNTDTIWDLRSTSDPQIAKDGKSVIYVLGWSDKMTDQRLSNLWMVSGDGKDNRPLDRPSLLQQIRDLFDSLSIGRLAHVFLRLRSSACRLGRLLE